MIRIAVKVPGLKPLPSKLSVRIHDGDFNEGDHPRASDGKFGQGSGKSASGAKTNFKKTHEAFKLSDGRWAVESTTHIPQRNGFNTKKSKFTPGIRFDNEEQAKAWIAKQGEGDKD